MERRELEARALFENPELDVRAGITFRQTSGGVETGGGSSGNGRMEVNLRVRAAGKLAVPQVISILQQGALGQTPWLKESRAELLEGLRGAVINLAMQPALPQRGLENAPILKSPTKTLLAVTEAAASLLRKMFKDSSHLGSYKATINCQLCKSSSSFTPDLPITSNS